MGHHTLLCNQSEFQPTTKTSDFYLGTLEAVKKNMLATPSIDDDETMNNITVSCSNNMSPQLSIDISFADAPAITSGDDDSDVRVEKQLFPDTIESTTIESHGSEPILIRRSSDPISEFQENQQIFAGGFVGLFIFGMGSFKDLGKGSLPKAFVQHLLRQRTGKFGQNRKFLFTVMNQLQRHTSCREVSLQARTKPSNMREVGVLSTDPAFRAKVERSIRAPDGVEAREVMNILRPIISITGGKIPYSPSERATGITTMYSYCQYYGLPSVFLTVAPDAMHNGLVIRLSHANGANSDFPAVGGPFMDALQNGAVIFEENIPIAHSNLYTLANDNPTAEAEVFQLLVDVIYEVLLGFKRKQYYRKTTPYSTRTKGIFSKVFAAFGANETQARRLLHIHLVIWATLSPSILQNVAAFKELAEIAGKVLDSMFSCTIPSINHLESYCRLLTLPEERTELIPVVYSSCPCIERNPVAYRNRHCSIRDRSGVHQHMQTCRKGKIGKSFCRLCQPRALNVLSGPVQIRADLTGFLPFKVESNIDVPTAPISYSEKNFKERPFNSRDMRCIIWEIQRTMPRFLNFSTPDLMELICRTGYKVDRSDFPDTIENLGDTEFLAFQNFVNKLEKCKKEDQVIVLECLKYRNCAVVETSVHAAAMLACNTAAYSLGIYLLLLF